MKHINSETCKWMKVDGELMPFSEEIPNVSNGNVTVKYYLSSKLDSLEDEFKGNEFVHKVSLAKMDVTDLKSLKCMCEDCTSLIEIEYNDNISENVDITDMCDLTEVKLANIPDTKFTYIHSTMLDKYLTGTAEKEYRLAYSVNVVKSLNVNGAKYLDLNSYTISNKESGVSMFNLLTAESSVTLKYNNSKQLDWTILTQGTTPLAKDYKVVWNAGKKTLSLTEKDEKTKLTEFLSSGKGEYKLEADITTGVVLYPKVDNLTIDLNGHSISNGTAKANNLDVILIKVPTGMTLTIKDSVGTGKVDAGDKLNRSMQCVAVEGTLNIEGGYFTVGLSKNSEPNSCIFVNGGTANISGGKFESTGANSNGVHYVLNMLDNSASTISVTGGEFIDFDPSKPMTEPDKTISFLAEGYKVSETDGIFTVTE